MKARTRFTALLLAGLIAPGLLLARQSLLKNGSMESGQGSGGIDQHVPAYWTLFGPTTERSDEANFLPLGSGHALKAYSSDPQVGAYQDVPVVPGDQVQISGSLYTRATDKLSGDAQAWIILEFYNASDQQTGFHPLEVLNASSPADTWVPGTVGPFAAPANTTYARMTCVWTWGGSATGSAFWDDCQMTINAGANVLLNSDFEEAGVGTGTNPFGIDDWSGFNDQARSEDFAKDGVASVKIGTVDAYSGLYQKFGTLFAGDHIYMTAHIWNPAADPMTGTTKAGLKLEFSAGGQTPPAEELLAFDANEPVDTWTLVELSTVVPDGITIGKMVCIYVGDPNTSGAVHFDSAWAERGSAPGVNQLANSSFEDGSGGQNGLDGWTEFDSSISDCEKACFEVPALDGICTAKATGTSVAGVVQEFTVTPGESVTVRAYLYSSSTEPLTGTGLAGIKIEWAYGGIPTNIDIGGAPNTIDASAAQDQWTPVYIDYTMPAGSSATGQFTNIVARGDAESGTTYFDACEAVVLNRFDGSDVDADNDEDLHDFAWFQHRFTGAGAGQLPWNGIVFDHDDDLDIDIVDYNWFEPRMLGPVQ